jgi:hypothetical protein
MQNYVFLIIRDLRITEYADLRIAENALTSTLMAENSATTKSKGRRRVDEIASLFGNAHVFPSKEKWAAQKGMSYRTFGTQAEAIKYAERVAKLTDSVNKKSRKHRLAQPVAARVRGRSGTFRIPVPRSGSTRVVLHEKSGKITQIR